MARWPTIYLAGPDVFRPDAIAWGDRARQAAAGHGLRALFPLDAGADPDDPTAIFQACLDLLGQADAVVANLTPFRGPSADVGTAFELGWAHARGMPLFAWSAAPTPIADRIDDRRVAADGHAVDAAGWQVEAFGLADNLMLIAGLAAPVVGDLEAALRHCAAWYADNPLDRNRHHC